MAEENDDVLGDICLDDIPEKPPRMLPDPVFPIKPDSGLLSADEMEDLLDEIQADPSLLNDLEADDILAPPDEAVDDVERATPDARTPCGPNGECPPGQICVNGFCEPDPNSLIPGNITKADLDSRRRVPDASGVNKTLDSESQKLKNARELFNQTRFVPEFPDGARFRFFTSANKKINLFLPQSDVLYREIFSKVGDLKSKLNKLRSYISAIQATKDGKTDLIIDDVLNQDGRILGRLMSENYGSNAIRDTAGNSTSTVVRNAFVGAGSLEPRNRLTKENLLSRTYIPSSFINDHSDIFAELFSSMDQEQFNSRYGQDLNLNGTAKLDPFIANQQSYSVEGDNTYFFTLNTDDAVRVFLSAIYQQSKKFITRLPDLYGDNSNKIIDSLISSITQGGNINSDEAQKYANMLLDDRDLSWIMGLEEDMNPAAYNLILPSDYKSSIFYQYLTKTSPRAQSIPNVTGKATKGFDPLRQAMGLHYMSVEDQERETALPFDVGNGPIKVSDNLFHNLKSFVSKDNGLYYPGVVRTNGTLNQNQPIRLEKIKEGHPDYRVAMDPDLPNPSLNELGTYPGAIFPQTNQYKRFVVSRGANKWKYESDLFTNADYKANDDSVLRSALSSTKEYFKIAYSPSHHAFVKAGTPMMQNDSGQATKVYGYDFQNEGIRSGLSVVRDLGLHDELGQNILVNANLSKFANSENLGTQHQEDIRNYLALGFNFRNWLYGFGVHPYFGGYKNIREEAQKKLTIEKSYNTSEFYSKFMPLGRFEHKVGETFRLGVGSISREGYTARVPLFCPYNSWLHTMIGANSTTAYYNPTPVAEEISWKKYSSTYTALGLDRDENGDALLAESLHTEWGKLYAAKSSDVADTPFSTNLFPVIPFYSNHNPIEYLEGDSPYENIPSVCFYGTENYINNEEYQGIRPLSNMTFGKDALPPWPQWVQSDMERSATFRQVASSRERNFNLIGSLITDPGRGSAGVPLTDDSGLHTYKIAPNLNNVPSPKTGQNISFGAVTDFSNNMNMAIYSNQNLNVDYINFSSFMNHPLINPNLCPPTAGSKAVFQDFYTQVPVFLNKQELKDKFQIKTNDHFDIEPVYNFFNSSYEDLISEVNLNRIPTPYLMHNLTKNSTQGDFSRLENMIEEAGSQTIYNKLLPEAQAINDLSFRVDDKDFKKIFEEKHKNPMYVQMEFSSKQKSLNGFADSISKAIIKKGDNNTYYDNLISTLINNGGDLSGISYEPSVVLSELSQYGGLQNDASNTLQNPRILNYTAAKEEISKSGFETALSRHRERITSNLTGRVDGVDVSAVKTIPFDQWLDSLEVPSEDELLSDDDMSLDDIFIKFLNKRRLIRKLKKLIDDKKRSMEEVFNGVPAYSETIAYKVTKYEVDSENLEFIEGTETNFYFSNIEDEDIVRFFDSQVQYGKLYRYEVYRIIVTVGTKYAYFDNNTQTTINDLFLKTGPFSHLSREESIRLCFINPLLASQLSIITLKTAMKISSSQSQLNSPEGNDEERRDYVRSIRAAASVFSRSGAFSGDEGGNDIGRRALDGLGMNANEAEFFEDARGYIMGDVLFQYNDMVKTFRSNNDLNKPAFQPLVDLAEKDIAIYFGTISRPDVKIVEVLDRSRNLAVLDKPPVPPEADILPIINNQRNILLSFQTGLGEFYDNPVPLEDDDYEQFKIAAYAQGIDGSVFDSVSDDQTSGPMLHFKSDDKARFFEVFRIEEPPESWEDFYNFKIAKIETENGMAQMYDSIIPNKEYYYTFRSEDIHGHVSNPSQIYKIVKRVVDQGSSLEKELYRFEKGKQLLDQKREFNRFIEIKPSIENRRINIEFIEQDPESGDVYGTSTDHFGSGTNIDHKPWNKKFKIRLTSKSSGRQIEVNINYQLIYNKDGVPETTRIVADYIGDQHFLLTRENIENKVRNILKKNGLLKE